MVICGWWSAGGGPRVGSWLARWVGGLVGGLLGGPGWWVAGWLGCLAGLVVHASHGEPSATLTNS